MPPHHDWPPDKASGSSSRRRDKSGRKRARPGFSNTPLPSELTTVTAPRRSTSTNPTTPSCESARRSSGSE
ncbi:Uncharacterised protein [Mycobacteroides abscessus subsp. abscessus]|nr:Uncharacterised protein [Mycobacteroides abscessus subsp. abscessus]